MFEVSVNCRLALYFVFIVAIFFVSTSEAFEVGIGVSDATGLCGSIQMMGYAEMGQQATGIHMRLKARGNNLIYIYI
jgi:Neutral/alkaline non-lysosomal ceramidase, N-terminal